MSVIFIVCTAIITIIAGISLDAKKYGTPIGDMIEAASHIILTGLIISVFYYHGIITGILYIVAVFLAAGLSHKLWWSFIRRIQG